MKIDLLEWGEVESYAEYEDRWHEDYPDETCWYRLVTVESFNRDDALSFRAVAFGDKTIVSADMNREDNDDKFCRAEDQAVELCGILTDLAKEAMTNFTDLTKNGCAILMITHDIDLAAKYADTIAVFYDGEIIDVCSAEDFRQGKESLKHPYTRALWDALPQNTFIGKKGVTENE